MPSADNAYRLVLFDAPENPQAVRDLLSAVTGIHPTDAMQWVAKAPGVWPRPLREGEVRELLDALYEIRVPAEAWRADLLPNLSPARSIHDAACLDEGWRVKGLRGEPTHWVPWDKVELICVGRIMLEDEFRSIAPTGWVRAVSTGLNAMLHRPQMIVRQERSMRIPHQPVGELILVRRDPRIAFRVAENRMTYASLGEKRLPTAAENFPVYVREILERVTDCYTTQSTTAFLDGGDPAEYEFPSSQALLDHATLKLLWSWYRRDRDSATETES